MSKINNRVTMKEVNFFTWFRFKRAFLRFFGDDPEMEETSFLQRFFLFRKVRKNAENYFCHYDSKQAGFLSLRTNKGTEAFIYGIAVEPEFRGKGLGKFMMRFSEERAQKTNKKFMALGVKSNNEPAIGLYKKFDYNRLGEGITYLEKTVEKRSSDISPQLKLETIQEFTDEIQGQFQRIIFSIIEEKSGSDGIEYMEENRIPMYNQQLKSFVSKSKGQLLRIQEKERPLGFLLLSQKGKVLKGALYSTRETWNTNFFTDLFYSLIEQFNLEEDDKIIIRTPIHVVESLENLNASTIQRDKSRDKLLMFKKLS
ncbi:MAG: GNAT family N-acetyltransferase [Candidatus Heimdallarchaeota archaeon]|nr:GNAT family N-acetyltransferase [Candidatus Heimdallarchaeota archaeon]